jgi:hypothetical protein
MEYVRMGHIGVFFTPIVGNILATSPLPFVAWFYSGQRKIKQVCVLSLIATAVIEPAQLLINVFLGGPSNIVDADDLI